MKSLYLLLVLLVAACSAAPAPTLPPSPAPSRSAPAVLPPQATPDPRSVWPPTLTDFVPASARLIYSSEVDTDGDGVNELLVIYQEGRSGRGLVIRREGANGRAYPLGGDKPVELFQDAWTGNTVRDINADGKIEVMVEGIVKGATTTVSVFQWTGKAYATLLSLTGTQGVAIDDAQARGVFDFTALQMLFERSSVIRATHAEWDKGAYAVESDVLFLLGTPDKINYPEEAALAYYIFLDKDQPADMYALLTEPQASQTPQKALEDLSRTLDNVTVSTLALDDEQADSARASLEVVSVEHGTGKAQSAQVVWRLKKENGQWRLAERLDKNP